MDHPKFDFSRFLKLIGAITFVIPVFVFGQTIWSWHFSSKRSISPPQPVKGSQYSTKISATVGENYLTISGYTSPFAQVTLTSSAGNLNRETTADSTGFFVFKSIFLPKKIGEISLLAEDTAGLVSSPVFLPEPPNNQDVFIENILLSPTITVAESQINPGETISASGKTFPNSQIEVHLYADPKLVWWQTIKEVFVKTAQAKMAPNLTVLTDNLGNFEFNLPTSEPATQRIFVAGLLKNNYSPKSFTLSFKTLSWLDKLGSFLRDAIIPLFIWLNFIFKDPLRIIIIELFILAFLLIKIALAKPEKKAELTSPSSAKPVGHGDVLQEKYPPQDI